MNPRILALLSSSPPLVAAFERVAAQMENPVLVVADADTETLLRHAGHLGASCLFAEWDGQRQGAQELSQELDAATALGAPLVLLAPAHAPGDRLEQCLNAGATDILRCPFSDADLRGRLRLLGLREAAPAGHKENGFVTENAPAGLGLVVERRFVYVNPTMSRLTGLSREKLLSRDALDIVHPDDRQLIGRNYAARLAGQPVPEEYAFRLLGPDGRIVWVQTCATLVQWQGRPATVNVFTDISGEYGWNIPGAPSDAEWREVVERTPAMLYEVEIFPAQESVGRLLFFSPEVITLTGYPPSYFSATSARWRELVFPEDRAGRLETLCTAIAQGRDSVQDYRIVTREGDVRWVRDHSRIVRAATEDQPALVQGAVIDITYRVEVEEALLRYKAAVDSSNDLIAAVDAAGRISLVNDTMLRYYGLKREQAVGTLFAQVLTPASSERVSDYFRRCLAGESGTFEITADLPNYPECTLAVSYAAIFDHSGRATGCVVVARDITLRICTQAALEASEERFRRIIELLPLPVLLLRDNRRIEYVNRQFTELLGYTLEEAADAEAWFDMACPEVRERRNILAAWDKQVHEKDWHPMPQEAYDITCKDGSRRNLAFSTVTLNEHDIFVVCEDMTERRRAAEALRKSRDFLETMLHHLPLDVWARDVEQRVILQNAESIRLWGDLTGQSVPETVHDDPSVAPIWKDLNRRALAGEVVREEVGYVLQGERRYFYVIVAPIPGPAGLQGTLGINVDITERKRTQDALEKRLRYERCLSELSRRLLMGANEGEGLQAALRPLLEASQSDRVCLSVEGEGDWCVTAGPQAGPRVQPSLVVGVHGEVCGPLPARWLQRLKQGLPVHGSARTLSRTDRAAFARQNVLSLLALPVVADGSIWGILRFVDMRKERAWDVSDIAPLQTAAEIVSTSLARQRLQREILEIADREQSRIGQDLHDGICQDLLGISYMADHLRLELEKKPSLRMQAARLREISEAIGQAVTRTRSLARGLSPVELDPEGIADSLEALAGHISTVFRVACTFTSDPGVSVKDPGMATHLYRIVQEATNNSIRHGHAAEIRISLRSGRGRCVLAIQDDGSGFDLGSSKRGGMGLRIMRHRAEMIDCVFKVRSRPGQGTTITCTWQKDNGRTGSAAWAGSAGERGVHGVREKQRPYKTRTGAAKTARPSDAEENPPLSEAGPDEEVPNTGSKGGSPPGSTVIYPHTQREEETKL